MRDYDWIGNATGCCATATVPFAFGVCHAYRLDRLYPESKRNLPTLIIPATTHN